MKTLALLIATIFLAPSVLAQYGSLRERRDPSPREKRQKVKTHFQMDASGVNPPTFNETIFNEVTLEKPLLNETSWNKTERVQNGPVLKSAPAPKKRKATHLREWP
jgi:hypothetical protein